MSEKEEFYCECCGEPLEDEDELCEGCLDEHTCERCGTEVWPEELSPINRYCDLCEEESDEDDE